MPVRLLLAAACAAALSACATDSAPVPTAGACAGFGCASARNLEAMAADPADLAQGVELAPASGDAAVAAARRHRTGETKPLPDGLSGDAYGPEG